MSDGIRAVGGNAFALKIGNFPLAGKEVAAHAVCIQTHPQKPVQKGIRFSLGQNQVGQVIFAGELEKDIVQITGGPHLRKFKQQVTTEGLILAANAVWQANKKGLETAFGALASRFSKA